MDQVVQEAENNKTKGFGFTPIGKVKDKRIKWLIKDIIPNEALVFISAPPKEGKSLFALYTSICLAKKSRFLGIYPVRRAKVLYCSLEDHRSETKARARAFLKGRRFPRNLYLSNANVITLPVEFQRLEKDIDILKPGVVVIDTLRRTHSLEENSSSDMSPILNKLRDLIRQYKITIIVIHHAGHKIEDFNKSGDWLRGTSDLDASWEVLIGLKRLADHTKMFVFHKYRPSFDTAYQTISGEKIDKQTGSFPIADLVFNDPDKEIHVRDEKEIKDALKNNSLSGNALEELLKVKKLSRPKIDSALIRMGEKGEVCQQGRGRESKWYLK